MTTMTSISNNPYANFIPSTTRTAPKMNLENIKPETILSIYHDEEGFFMSVQRNLLFSENDTDTRQSISADWLLEHILKVPAKYLLQGQHGDLCVIGMDGGIMRLTRNAADALRAHHLNSNPAHAAYLQHPIEKNWLRHQRKLNVFLGI